MLPIIEQAKKKGNKIAIYAGEKSFTYNQLIHESNLFSSQLIGDIIDLKEARVAFMVNPGFEYVKTLWAIWQAGGVAVPLCITHPLPSLQYVLEDAIASYLVISKEYYSVLQPFINTSNIKTFIIDDYEIDFEKFKLKIK